MTAVFHQRSAVSVILMPAMPTEPAAGLPREPGAAGGGPSPQDQAVTPKPTTHTVRTDTVRTETVRTDAWGIDATWLDALDQEHEVAESTIEGLREVIGRPPEDLEERAPIV